MGRKQSEGRGVAVMDAADLRRERQRLQERQQQHRMIERENKKKRKQQKQQQKQQPAPKAQPFCKARAKSKGVRKVSDHEVEEDIKWSTRRDYGKKPVTKLLIDPEELADRGLERDLAIALARSYHDFAGSQFYTAQEFNKMVGEKEGAFNRSEEADYEDEEEIVREHEEVEDFNNEIVHEVIEEEEELIEEDDEEEEEEEEEEAEAEAGADKGDSSDTLSETSEWSWESCPEDWDEQDGDEYDFIEEDWALVSAH